MVAISSVLTHTSINQDLYNSALTSLHRNMRLYNPSIALSRDADFWEKALLDPAILHAREQRSHSVAGRPYTVNPASKEPADKLLAGIFGDAVKKIDNLEEGLYQACDAIYVGQSYAFLEGVRKFCRLGGIWADWWYPTRMKNVNYRRFHWGPYIDRDAVTGARTLKVNQKFWSVLDGIYKPWTNPEYFFKWVYGGEAEHRLGYGTGLADCIYTWWYAKNVVLEEGLQGLERWAQGFLVAKIDGLREGSKINEAVRKDWEKALVAHRSRHVLTHDSRDEVTLVQHPGTGHDMVLDFLNYFDRGIDRVMLGSVLPTGGGGGDSAGSLARANTEVDSREILFQYDAMSLSRRFTNDVGGLFFMLNQPILVANGLADAGRPKFQLIREEMRDPAERAATAKQLLSIPGFRLKEEEIYESTGWSQPSEGDAVVVGMAATSPLGLGTPPGFGLDDEDDSVDETADPDETEPAPPPQEFRAKPRRVIRRKKHATR